MLKNNTSYVSDNKFVLASYLHARTVNKTPLMKLYGDELLKLSSAMREVLDNFKAPSVISFEDDMSRLRDSMDVLLKPETALHQSFNVFYSANILSLQSDFRNMYKSVHPPIQLIKFHEVCDPVYAPHITPQIVAENKAVSVLAIPTGRWFPTPSLNGAPEIMSENLSKFDAIFDATLERHHENLRNLEVEFEARVERNRGIVSRKNYRLKMETVIPELVTELKEFIAEYDSVELDGSEHVGELTNKDDSANTDTVEVADTLIDTIPCDTDTVAVEGVKQDIEAIKEEFDEEAGMTTLVSATATKRDRCLKVNRCYQTLYTFIYDSMEEGPRKKSMSNIDPFKYIDHDVLEHYKKYTTSILDEFGPIVSVACDLFNLRSPAFKNLKKVE